jgi:nucleoredoxin
VSAKALQSKTLALYFSASWCPPCRAFTPALASTYENKKKSNDDFEFLFVSADKDPASFAGYHAKMPFPALPFEKRDECMELSSLFGVSGYPTLVTVSPDGKVISKNCVSQARADPTGSKFPWTPNLVEELSQTGECNGSDLNETPALVIFADGASADTHAHCAAALNTLAATHADECKASGNEDPDLLFFTATKHEGPVPQIKKLAKMNPAKETCGNSDATPVLMLLDIPDNGGFYTQILPAGVVEEGEAAVTTTVKTFVAAYKAGALQRFQLS